MQLNKVLIIFGMLVLAFTNESYAEDKNGGKVILDGKSGYVEFQAPDGSFFEYIPFIGGKNREVRDRHCARFLLKACGNNSAEDRGSYSGAAIDQLRGRSSNRACEAWRKDCGGFTDIPRIKEKYIEMCKANEILDCPDEVMNSD